MKNKKLKFSLLWVLLFLFIYPGTSYGATIETVIDTTEPASHGSKSDQYFSGSNYKAQAFTIGSSGGALNSVTIQDAYINPYTSGYDFGIYSANGDGTIGSELLGFDSTPTHSGSGFLILDAEGSLNLSANTTYWLLGKMSSNTFWWKYDNSAPAGTGSVPATKYRAKSSNGGSSYSYDTDVSSTAYGTGTWYYDFKLTIDTDVDVDNPTLFTLSPTDESTDIALSSDLIITFSEDVDVESGDIVIYKSSDDSEFETIDVTSGQVTGTGTDTITINPSSDFSGGTEYYVQIDATAFDDTAGNSFAGISSETTWNFTTVAVSTGGRGMFLVKTSAPEITVGEISDTSMSVKGKYDGYRIITDSVGFEYWEKGNEEELEKISFSNSPNSYSYRLRNLDCNTKYEIRGFSKNSLGIVYSDTEEFKTQNCQKDIKKESVFNNSSAERSENNKEQQTKKIVDNSEKLRIVKDSFGEDSDVYKLIKLLIILGIV